MAAVSEPARILLVRLSAIGDIVFASPLVSAVRRTYPHAHLAWLVQPEYRSLLEHHPDLDEVISWPIAEWRRLWHRRRFDLLSREVLDFRRLLRSRRFELAVDLQGLLKSGLLTYLSGARERVGLGSREGSRLLMTRVLPRGGDADRIGSEYLYLAQQLGLASQGFSMTLAYGDEDAAFARDLMDREGLPGRFAVLCPFTTRPQKHWLDARWAALAAALHQDMGLPAVLLGAPADRERARSILGSGDGTIIDLVGRTSLLQAAALIDRSNILIGVDTGLSHMGIAYDRPSLLLFGSTCPYLDTGRPNARVIYHRHPCSPCKRNPTCDNTYDCMRSIRVDEVLDKARELLQQSP